MGNAIHYHENLKKTVTDRMSKALRSFIEKECPIYLIALNTDDYKLKEIFVKQFNESFSSYIFDNIYSILPHFERLRLNQVNQLKRLTLKKFNLQTKIQLSCIPCKINDYLTIAYFDTGCSISCLTLANAKRLNLTSLIDHNLNGIAIGFGCNRSIVGLITNLPVQISSELIFNVNFIVINQADADFILIGQDFLQKYYVQMDYLNAKITFPKQIINKYELNFMPNDSNKRDHFFDLFKYEMLEHNRCLINNYFNTKFINQLPDQFDEHFPNQHKSTNTNLYVKIQIYGKKVFALLDTGADSSKISDNLALQLDILRFIDYNKTNTAYGLGSVKSIGQIPAIPVKFESSFDTNSNEKSNYKILFVPFEVLSEKRVNILLLGSDFLTYYGCLLDFKSKSIDITIDDDTCTYKFFEREPSIKSMNERSILLNHNYLENLNESLDNIQNNDEILDVLGLSSELDEFRLRIAKKEHDYQRKKKIKKYKIENENRLQLNSIHLFGRMSKAKMDCEKMNYLKINELDEIDKQTYSLINDENGIYCESINDIQKFKNQTMSNQIFCNGFIDEFEIKDSLVQINFINKNF